MTKEQLKAKLLALACFDNNEYFENYVQLCIDNQDTKKVKYVTNAHHIVPRKYYKFNKLEIDNSTENLVNLTYYDHILAHYYLVLCSIPAYLQYSNATAFVMSIGKEKLTLDEIRQIRELDKYIDVYKNYKSKPKAVKHKEALSNARDFHATTKGKKSIYSSHLDKVKFVTEQELANYLQNGWILGGRPLSSAAKQKISQSNRISLKGKKHADIKPNKTNSGLVGAKIICVETGQIFKNILEAKTWLYKNTGVNGGQIKNCCSGSRKTTGGYHWQFYKEVDNK